MAPASKATRGTAQVTSHLRDEQHRADAEDELKAADRPGQVVGDRGVEHDPEHGSQRGGISDRVERGRRKVAAALRRCDGPERGNEAAISLPSGQLLAVVRVRHRIADQGAPCGKHDPPRPDGEGDREDHTQRHSLAARVRAGSQQQCGHGLEPLGPVVGGVDRRGLEAAAAAHHDRDERQRVLTTVVARPSQPTAVTPWVTRTEVVPAGTRAASSPSAENVSTRPVRGVVTR